jgi:hypothetical protein
MSTNTYFSVAEELIYKKYIFFYSFQNYFSIEKCDVT